MPKPLICLQCASKPCEHKTDQSLGVCEYGVAYASFGDGMEHLDALVPLRLLSKNLRHELHRLLAIIIQEAISLKPSISIKNIDPKDPVERIVGTTVIIDQFVQMLTGVNEFHATVAGSQEFQPHRIQRIISNYFAIYSIVSNEQRACDLSLNCSISSEARVTIHGDIFEYLVAILLDNAWKYSLSNTTIHVSLQPTSGSLGDIIFRNRSNPLPLGFSIFEKGTQAKPDSEGFGYGLFWASILVDHYNNAIDTTDAVLSLEHEEKRIDDNIAEQVFTIRNVSI